jgi:hypothetical protein
MTDDELRMMAEANEEARISRALLGYILGAAGLFGIVVLIAGVLS